MATSISEVNVANMALATLGADRITSLDENTEAAKKVNAVFTMCFLDLLAQHPWTAATTRADLGATLSESPAYGFSNYFQLPTNSLRVLRTEDDTVYAIEGDRLLSDESSVKIQYIWNNTDLTLYNPDFCMALAGRIALELSYGLTDSNTHRQFLQKEYELKLNVAKSTDSQGGGTPPNFIKNTLLEARGTGTTPLGVYTE